MTHAERISLQQLRYTEGYVTLRKLMDEMIERAESDCFALDPVNCDAASILASHSRARAQREGFTALISRVNHEVDELKAELEERVSD